MGPVPTAGSIGKVALDPLAGRLSVTAAAGTWTFGFEKNRDVAQLDDFEFFFCRRGALTHLSDDECPDVPGTL